MFGGHYLAYDLVHLFLWPPLCLDKHMEENKPNPVSKKSQAWETLEAYSNLGKGNAICVGLEEEWLTKLWEYPVKDGSWKREDCSCGLADSVCTAWPLPRWVGTNNQVWRSCARSTCRRRTAVGKGEKYHIRCIFIKQHRWKINVYLFIDLPL